MNSLWQNRFRIIFYEAERPLFFAFSLAHISVFCSIDKQQPGLLLQTLGAHRACHTRTHTHTPADVFIRRIRKEIVFFPSKQRCTRIVFSIGFYSESSSRRFYSRVQVCFYITFLCFLFRLFFFLLVSIAMSFWNIEWWWHEFMRWCSALSEHLFSYPHEVDRKLSPADVRRTWRPIMGFAKNFFNARA